MKPCPLCNATGERVEGVECAGCDGTGEWSGFVKIEE